MISLIVGILIVLASLLYWRSRDSRLPPGPKGVPLLGIIPFLPKCPFTKYMEWGEKYGGIFTARVGTRDSVILTDYDIINEVVVKHGENVAKRPTIYIIDMFARGRGLIFSNGKIWEVQRLFITRVLRRFRSKGHILETRVIEQSERLIDAILGKHGDSFDPKELIQFSTVSVSASVFFGKMYTYDDAELHDITKKLVRGVQDNTGYFLLLALCPMLRYIPPFNRVLKDFLDDSNGLIDLFKRFIREHQLSHNPNKIKDVMDAFIEEMNKENHDASFTEDQAAVLVKDLMDGGSLTTTCALLWMLLALARYPKYQKEIREEIDTVVGRQGSVTVAHRESMPLIQAFISEVMRTCTIVFQAGLSTTQETKFKDFTIPENTTINAMIWCVHNNPRYFENPKEFRPERFINENGEFVKSRYFIPFSVGRRNCVGEHLARMEIFMFLEKIIKRFEICADDVGAFPKFDEGRYGVVYVPPIFKLRFVERV